MCPYLRAIRTDTLTLQPMIVATTERGTPASNVRVQPVCLRSWIRQTTPARIFAVSQASFQRPIGCVGSLWCTITAPSPEAPPPPRSRVNSNNPTNRVSRHAKFACLRHLHRDCFGRLRFLGSPSRPSNRKSRIALENLRVQLGPFTFAPQTGSKSSAVQ